MKSFFASNRFNNFLDLKVCLMCPSLRSNLATWEDASETSLTHLFTAWEWQGCFNMSLLFLMLTISSSEKFITTGGSLKNWSFISVNW